MTTFKQKIAAKEIKRADAMKVRLEDLHVEPGFNLRDENAVGDDGMTFQDSIKMLAEHIAAGGVFPALEVRPRQEGGVWIVDGHRRARAIALAYVEMGAKLERLADKDGYIWVPVVPFDGDSAARTMRIITSAEGRGLTPLEMAKGFKRLRDVEGWSADQIAKAWGRDKNRVGQLLRLADAQPDVHEMVSAGKISAALATEMVRKHGDEAGEKIAQAATNARGKVTAGTVKPKPLPRPLVDRTVDALGFLMTDGIPNDTHQAMVAIHDGHGDRDQMVKVDAGALYELIGAYQAVMDEMSQQRAKEAAKRANDNQQTIEDAA